MIFHVEKSLLAKTGIEKLLPKSPAVKMAVKNAGDACQGGKTGPFTFGAASTFTCFRRRRGGASSPWNMKILKDTNMTKKPWVLLDASAPEAAVIVAPDDKIAILVRSSQKLDFGLPKKGMGTLGIVHVDGRNRLVSVRRTPAGLTPKAHLANLPSDPRAIFQTEREAVLATLDPETGHATDLGGAMAIRLSGPDIS